tara:strand:- start:493 stop:1107 length:615 start_codon:yes stop_codon:yes gene_type:complete
LNPTFRNISNHAAYAIWRVSASEETLYPMLDEDIPNEIEKYHPHKKIEFLASRILMKKLCEFLDVSYNGIWKDECGKPHLENSQCHISISHSYPYVVCMVDQQQPCGIDIEAPREKLLRIKHKFLSQEEQNQVAIKIDLLCQYWCAKEALYKLYGRKKLSFSKDIYIEQLTENMLTGNIQIGEKLDRFKLKSELIDGHYLVYNI